MGAEITDKCNCENIEGEIKRFRNHLNAYKRFLHHYDKTVVGDHEISGVSETPKDNKKYAMNIPDPESIIEDAYMSYKNSKDEEDIGTERDREKKEQQSPLSKDVGDHEDGSVVDMDGRKCATIKRDK